MRLLYCENCSDAFRLQRSDNDTHCQCGRSYGRLNEQGHIVTGGPSVVLGVREPDLKRAIKTNPATGAGQRFYAFVMPTDSPAIEKESNASSKAL